MKLLGNLLLTLGLVLGALSAATGYLVPLDAADERFRVGQEDGQPLYLTLASPAGGQPRSEAALAHLRQEYEAGRLSGSQYLSRRAVAQPLLAAGQPLTPEHLAHLRTAGVRYVRVQQFSFARWPLGWLFLLAAAGLAGGSLVVRTATRREILAATAGRRDVPEELSPAHVLATIRTSLDALLAELPHLAVDAQRNQVIVRAVGDLLASQVPALIDQRARIVGLLGLGGYAALMDRFAAAERQLNRAWSAAADGHAEEATECLRRSLPLWSEAAAKLDTGQASSQPPQIDARPV